MTTGASESAFHWSHKFIVRNNATDSTEWLCFPKQVILIYFLYMTHTPDQDRVHLYNILTP